MSWTLRTMSALLVASLPVLAMASTVGPDDVKFEDDLVATPLSDTAGDPVNGRKVFADRKLGNCLACHVNSDLSNELFHGEVGPPMDGVADRWEVPELRAILVNSKVVFGDQTIMPSFYHLHNGERIMESFQGKTILTAQEVEDVIAYLQTLKE